MVKRLSFFLYFVILSGWCCYALADQTSAIDSAPANGAYTEGRMSLQLVSGALFSLTNLPEGSPELNYAQTNLRLGWMLGTPDPGGGALRGNWEGLVEVTNSFVFKGPGSYIGGVTGLLRYNFVQPDWDLVPYIQGGVGIVYNDIYKDDTQNAIGQAIEFTPQCSIGVHYLIGRNWAVAAEGMFHHISNAGLSNRNSSINSLGGFVGVTYFFD
jgi:lipid A 3-O-deacylase